MNRSAFVSVSRRILSAGTFFILVAMIPKAAVAQNRTYGPADTIKNYVLNSGVPLVSHCGKPGKRIHSSKASADKTCRIYGHSSAVSWTNVATDGKPNKCYLTPFNNSIIEWNGYAFIDRNANDLGNVCIDTITCTGTVSNECRDGVDNDKDGKIDALDDRPWDEDPTTFRFTSSTEIRAFVNSFPEYTDIPTIASYAGSAKSDPDTRLKICQLKGFEKVLSYKNGRYHSCHDNALGYWSQSANDFIIVNACTGGNVTLDELECGGKAPACADRADNDGDGKIDFPADTGCDSIDDRSEIPHDPKCLTPDSPSESEECRDTLDNDEDGKIDFPSDAGCVSPDDDSETGANACNDVQMKIDFTDVANSGSGNAEPILYLNNRGTIVKNGEWFPLIQDGTPIIDSAISITTAKHSGLMGQRLPSGKILLAAVGNIATGAERIVATISLKNAQFTSIDYAWQGSVVELPNNNRFKSSLTYLAGLDDEVKKTSSRTVSFKSVVSLDADPVVLQYGIDVSCPTQCSDNKDNDEDGATDYPADFSCSAASDDDEMTPLSKCQDTIDNDQDGAIDLADAGCASAQDNDENGEKKQCEDGKDNDGDNLTDLSDPGCSSPQDNDEENRLPPPYCPSTSLGVRIPGNAATGVRYNHTGATRRYRVEMFSPQNLSDADYLNYSWANWPTDAVARYHGSALFMMRNKAAVFGNVNGQSRVVNADYGFPAYFRDPPYNLSATKVANAARGSSFDIDLATGDYLTFIVNEVNGAYADNRGKVEVRICPIIKQCGDDVDNDSDGAIDFPKDSSCSSYDDDDETNPAQCEDQKDNDGDGEVDTRDFSCSGPKDNDETFPKAQCQDGIDNDSDGATDLIGRDFSCSNLNDNDETIPRAACQDGLDNDADGLIDLKDRGCTGNQDNDESGEIKECVDQKDNDSDGAIDYPKDASCSSRNDDDETNPKTQCQDKFDNDSDGLIDKDDPGCPNNQDNDEGDDKKQCEDLKDNDNDGFVDYPKDFSCDSAKDTDESLPLSQCQDGKDNDGDGFVDTKDKGCPNNQDNNEGDDKKQCEDLLDNDSDGYADYPKDFSCTSAKDDDEENLKSQCQDGKDNDTDGLIDNKDPGCSNSQDDNEGDDKKQCEDALDNDADGVTDYPRDFSCESAKDNDESTPKPQCQDGIDNDGDGAIDTADSGCLNNQDNDESDTCVLLHASTYSVGAASSAARLPATLPANVQVRTANLYSRELTAADIAGASLVVYGDWHGAHRTLNKTELTIFKQAYDSGTNFTFFADNPIIDEAAFGTRQIMNSIQTRMKYSDNTTGRAHSGIEAPDTVKYPYLLGKIFNFTGGLNSPGFIENLTAPAECGYSNLGFCIAAFKPKENKQGFVFAEGNWGAGPSGVTPGEGSKNYIGNFIARACNFPPPTQCNDKIDNDTDGAIDYPADFSCESSTDTDESLPKSQCQDNLDNDGDSLIDSQDPGCKDKQDNNEGDDKKECEDLKDNDLDSAIDYPSDFSCASAKDTDESLPKAQCQDGVDNDGDGRTDLNDKGCPNGQDNDEGDDKKQCEDGVDNDSDGAIDFPKDVSCSNTRDDDELNPIPQCQDGSDNDGDGLTDGKDPGCADSQDTDEGDDKKQCEDGKDNDGDGAIDYTKDFSCSTPKDDDESNPKSECQDGADNDGDNLADLKDPGCANNQDNNEGDDKKQCEDGVDNDSDGAIDFPNDYSCATAKDDDESSPKSQCQDGSDNDRDGLTDLKDPGCPNGQDNDEGDDKKQCEDGIDNDGDNAIDFPKDFSCSSAKDDDEANPKSGCQDGVDNDKDGLTDLKDPGCSDGQDDDESTDKKQCEDTLDNDTDGAIDYPKDFSCSSAKDDDESDPKSDCQDGIDNDRDGLTDSKDPGCSDGQDDDEGDDKKQCEDGKDNDVDGAIDFPKDFSCASAKDDDESSPKSQCQDGADNDKDGLTDSKDPGCSDDQDDDESTDKKQCEDAQDNDMDGATDYPKDFSCSSAKDDDEANPKSGCQDGTDNDKDGLIDRKDPGCSDDQDNEEGDDKKQCEDGKDNDGDNAIDYPKDFSCSSAKDDDEAGPKSQCQDGVDNDTDGSTDLDDAGCTDNQDDDESTDKKQCEDLKDNDSDGAIDYPKDFSCSTAKDNDETSPKSQCQDGIDNDTDSTIDYPADPGCSSAQDNDEHSPILPCDDELDNDGDGRIDLKDPGCKNPSDPNENDEEECQDLKDNDKDSKIDYPSDPGCSSATDKSELDNSKECDDGIDNDSDGKIDSDDPDCSDPNDDSEDPPAQCKDTKDNDGDGLTDYPADPGCSNADDNDEHGTNECDDGIDNDVDGKIDTKDSDCSDPKDPSEKPDVPGAVLPIVDCVSDNKDGTFTAYFGYQNIGTLAQVIPVASANGSKAANFFSPGAIDRGQVTVFNPGRTRGVFRVTFDGNALTWTVRGEGFAASTAVASKSSPGCSAVVPEFECVYLDTSSDLIQGLFGYSNPNDFDVTVPVGDENFFTPAPVSRGQPTFFRKGAVKSAFKATIPTEGGLSWIVNFNKASAVLSADSVCPDSKDQCNVTPTADISAELDKVALALADVAQKKGIELDKLISGIVGREADPKRVKLKIQKFLAEANSLKLKFPTIIKTCPLPGNYCVQIDNQETIEALRSLYIRQLAAIKRFTSRTKFILGERGADPLRGDPGVKKAKKMVKDGQAALKKLPRFATECKAN